MSRLPDVDDDVDDIMNTRVGGVYVEGKFQIVLRTSVGTYACRLRVYLNHFHSISLSHYSRHDQRELIALLPHCITAAGAYIRKMGK